MPAHVITAISQPIPETSADSIAEVGSRVTRVISEQPVSNDQNLWMTLGLVT
jgi:hypothetical protein